jgi:hypothetical protein
VAARRWTEGNLGLSALLQAPYRLAWARGWSLEGRPANPHPRRYTGCTRSTRAHRIAPPAKKEDSPCTMSTPQWPHHPCPPCTTRSPSSHPKPNEQKKNPKKNESLILAIDRKAPSAPSFSPPSHTHRRVRPLRCPCPVGSDGVRAVGGGEGAGAAHGVGGGPGDGAPRGAALGGGPPRPPARLGLAPALGSWPRRRPRRRRAAALRHARLLEGPAPRPSPRPARLRRRRAARGGGRGLRARVRNRDTVRALAASMFVGAPKEGAALDGITERVVLGWQWQVVGGGERGAGGGEA